ncbi:hypothetical protein GIB67_034680 [Kingdonia uniflora]|uniref:Phytocyanin domain-containing protein n=1 Tax=Kingdonia uniflora TaxID=39325 RepID=A0A7J7P0X2_9MAGN|nr:hypothetical protein GIB67_034680 [Kingdonia uniflora]
MTSTRAISSSLVLIFILFNFTEAKDHLVGGKTDGWKIPSSQSDSLNEWAQRSRFLTGDTLVWKYDEKTDSVLQVTRADYLNCNVSDPINQYKEGDTKVVLEKSGPYFFISGAKGHCEKGQKLIVVVLSSKHGYLAISPAPSPAGFEGSPAVQPTSNAPYGLKNGVVWMMMLGSLVGMILA